MEKIGKILVILCMMISCVGTVATSQVMSTYESIGDIPFKIQAEGWLSDKFRGGQSFFPDPVAEFRKGKVSSVIFGGSAIRLGVVNDSKKEGLDKWRRPDHYVYRIIAKDGRDVTLSCYREISRMTETEKRKFLQKSTILMDTTLKIGDYLFADFYDAQNDTLIKSFYFKRIKISPELITPANGNVIEVVPDTSNIISFKIPDIDLGQDLEYRFEGSEWIPCDHELKFDYLEADFSYELDVRYVFQPESARRFILKSQPYWYQTKSFQVLILVISCCTIACAAWGIQKRRIRSARQKQQSIRHQLKAIQLQLNPHFIFNSLSSIQGMINTERSAEANLYLSEFSSLMRQTLDGSDKIYNQLDKEIRTLDTYLKLEQLRFGFIYSIEVGDNLNTSEIDLPVLLLQPIVENSVKHGISGLKEKGVVRIVFSTDGKALISEVIDNGEGYSNQESSPGYGLKLTLERITLFNEMLGYNAVQFNSVSVGGCITIIKFNDWL